MRYFMIDRVLRLEYDRQLTAVKCAALSEDYFSDHFLGHPIMPGALQIESLAQAGTVLLEVSGRFRQKALLAMVHAAKFREPVHPGDKLRIEMSIVTNEEKLAQLDGSIFVDERLVTTGRLTFSKWPIDQYYLPVARQLTDALYVSIFRDATVVGGPHPGTQHD